MVSKDDIGIKVQVQVTEHIDVQSDQNTSIPQPCSLQIPTNHIGNNPCWYQSVQKCKKNCDFLGGFYGYVQWSITLG